MSPWGRANESEVSHSHDKENEGQMPPHWWPSMLKGLLKISWSYRNQTPTQETLGREPLSSTSPGALPAFITVSPEP